MPKRGKGFTKAELDHILDCIQEILPIGIRGWERVLEKFVLLYPNSERTKESLRKKFTSLYSSKIPTGDPKCPNEVKRAKRIYESIQEKMELSDGNGRGEDEDYDPESLFEDSVDDANGDDDDDDDAEDNGNIEGQNLNEADPAPQQHNPAAPNATPAGGEQSVGSGNKKVRRESSFNTPVFRRRGGVKKDEKSDDDSFGDIMKFMLMQRQMEVETDTRRREADDRKRELEEMRSEQRREDEQRRRDFEERRLEERRLEEDRRERRREEEQQRHNQMMEMFMMHIMSNGNSLLTRRNTVSTSDVEHVERGMQDDEYHDSKDN